MHALDKLIPLFPIHADEKTPAMNNHDNRFYPFFQDYDEILNFYGIWGYECPNPEYRAKQHPMRRHARYGRSLVLWDADACRIKEERMDILRLKCICCGTTHAILTMDIIPFFSYSIQAFLVLLSLCMEGSVPRTEEKTGVSIQLLYRFLKIFREYSGRIMLFLRQEGLRNQHCVDRILEEWKMTMKEASDHYNIPLSNK